MDPERTAVRIFDLIDAGRIGEAEGAIETALAKHPQSNGLLAAEALLLLRAGQAAKAQACAERLSEKDVTEPKAVNALVHVLQQTCSWAALVKVYEKLRPTQDSKNISENLLQAYVRMGNYKEVQRNAMLLYREYKDPKYQVWMVQALLGQVAANMSDDLSLTLATRMLDTSVLTETGMMKPTTVRAYVDVLVQQKLFDEAVAFLCTKRGSKIGLLETRLEVLAAVLKEQGKNTEANAVARHLWRMYPDNWTPFEMYMNTLTNAASSTVVFTLESDTPELQATIDCATADSTLEAAIALAKELQAKEAGSRKPQRGPFMAELALLDRQGSSAVAQLEDAVFAYVNRFYRKPCCYLDVSTFLSAKSAEKIYAWSMDVNPSAAELNQAEQLGCHARRILGLRCLVASWGCTADAQPSADEMKKLFADCVAAYDAAKPLSLALAWSEEGHCDAYITVALNIAFHAYCGSGHADTQWLVDGLELMQRVDRRMSNPSWLIFSVCFSSLVGLVDRPALHQLAFKSVQHDTMSHLGYWPLVRGLAKEDTLDWNSLAEHYYGQVDRDCSLLRAKVFTFVSWPAMKDVCFFERKQAISVTRWLRAPHEGADCLRECQTQKNIFKLLEEVSGDLWKSHQALFAHDAVDEAKRQQLVDNTDWLVARSNVLGNIHSDKVVSMTESLVQMPSMAWRVSHGRQLVNSMLLLHDVAMLERHRQDVAKAPKPRKKKDVVPELPKPTLYIPQMMASSSNDLPECLPSVAPLVPALVPYIMSEGKTAAASNCNDALKSQLDGLVQHAAADAWEGAMHHEVYILAALVRAGDAAKLPVKEWAASLRSVVATAQSKYQEGEWSVTKASGPAAGFVETLALEKKKRLAIYLDDLMTDVSASAQRR